MSETLNCSDTIGIGHTVIVNMIEVDKNNKTVISMNEDRKLLIFDNAMCREIAYQKDYSDGMFTSSVCISLLEAVAEEIRGEAAERIRNFNLEEKT